MPLYIAAIAISAPLAALYGIGISTTWRHCKEITVCFAKNKVVTWRQSCCSDVNIVTFEKLLGLFVNTPRVGREQWVQAHYAAMFAEPLTAASSESQCGLLGVIA